MHCVQYFAYICTIKMKQLTLKLNIMTAKEKKEIADKKLIQRAIDMYIFVHGKEPKSWWCTSADRARTLLDYYKSEFNIIG